MKPKRKPKDDPGCPYSPILGRMPPLSHYPNREEDFRISHSDVVLFIIFAMSLNNRRSKSWSVAVRLFAKARRLRLLKFDQRNRTWQGKDYRPGERHPRSQELVARIRAVRR
jgi:hypothetical protein